MLLRLAIALSLPPMLHRRPWPWSFLLLSCALLAQEPQDESAPAADSPAADDANADAGAAETAPAGRRRPADAAPSSPVGPESVRDLTWRNLGPANPMGRITALAVPDQDRSVWYVGTAGGGLWKTTNAGTTWRNVSESFASVSIGDVAVAPSDPNIVWVGTGEENARNSVQWGDGVYKSTDAGETWTHMGLRATFQIGHVAIHPQDADIIYVAALGRLWGDNEERGVFKTEDGGQTWRRVLHVDDRTGAIDVRLCPQDPSTVFACLYERKRDAFDGNDPAVRFSDQSGLYKSTDGGDSWQRLTQGLPTCRWGRSGIDVLPGSDTMFLIVETERSGWAKGDRKDRQQGDELPPEEQQQQARARQPRQSAVLGVGTEGDDAAAEQPGAVLTRITEGGAAAQAGLAPGDRITAIDGEPVKSYADLLEIVRDSRGGQQARFTYIRGEAENEVAVTYGTRTPENPLGGGNGPYSGRLFGQAANKQKYQGELGHETGGVFRSDDRGVTWTRLNSLTERPFYYSVLRVDPQDPARLYAVGTTLWASTDGGANFAGINKDIHVDFHAIWIDPRNGRHLLAGCDGGVNESFDGGASWQVHQGFCAAQYYDVVADNSVPYNVIGGLQDNGTWIGPSRTRWREGITFDDWSTIYGGDGFGAQSDPIEPWIVYATSQNGALGMLDLRTGQQTRIARQRPATGPAKFNWDSPFVLSPHNRLTLWSAGNHVFRSDRYAHLDHRDSDPGKRPVNNQNGMSAQPVSPPLGRTDDGTATALCESPRVRSLLYVGTDDGALWRGQPDGAWQELHGCLPGLPGPRYVSDLLASHHDDNRIYATLDGHRSDDMRTYVFVSEDRGESWASLAVGLPSFEPCYAIAEDPRNEDLLFLGTEYGCYVSLDRGHNWLQMGSALPTVAVRDLCIQDRDADLVAATHGRGVFVVDIAPLRALDAAARQAPVRLLPPQNAVLWRMGSRGLSGNKGLRAKNPPYGATLYVHCAAATTEPVQVTIHDVTGAEVAAVKGRAAAGLQALHWDARIGDRLARPGTYTARLLHDGKTQIRAFALLPDPATTPPAGRMDMSQEKE